jgi:hypothetical protein
MSFDTDYASLGFYDPRDVDWLQLDNGRVIVGYAAKDLVSVEYDLSTNPVTAVSSTLKK